MTLRAAWSARFSGVDDGREGKLASEAGQWREEGEVVMAVKRPGGGGGGYGPGPSIGAGKGMGRFSGGSIRGDQSKLAKWEKDLLFQARRVAAERKMQRQKANANKKQGINTFVGPKQIGSKTISSRKPSVPLKPSGNKSIQAAAKKMKKK